LEPIDEHQWKQENISNIYIKGTNFKLFIMEWGGGGVLPRKKKVELLELVRKGIWVGG
jgi:hypothetical protein